MYACIIRIKNRKELTAMPRSAKDVAKDLHENLLESGHSVITIENDKLYEIADRKRIRGSFLDDLKREIETIGHIFASGDKVHILSQDTNHSPIRR
jgi:hypothetical protein